MDADAGAAVLTVTAAGLARGAHGEVAAMADTTATGLIVALGAGGSFLLVLALTIRAARLSNRAGRAAAASHAQAAQTRQRRGRTRTRTRGGNATGAGAGAGPRTAKPDLYPPQPYSAHEPASHTPYSRPYRVPAQDEQHGRAKTNGHRPSGPVGVPTTPWDPTED